MRRAGTAAVILVCVGATGCGSARQPHLARTDAAPLIALANRIAGEDACAQKRDLASIRGRAIALINRHGVPAELQEPFLAGVNDLAGRTPACVPPAPDVNTTPPEEHDHGKHLGKHKHGDEG